MMYRQRLGLRGQGGLAVDVGGTSRGRPMVRSVLYLTPRQGNAAAVVDYYRRAGVLERARRQDGCLGAALHVPCSGSGPVLVTALWRDEKAYEGWVANPSRTEDAGEL